MAATISPKRNRGTTLENMLDGYEEKAEEVVMLSDDDDQDEAAASVSELKRSMERMAS